MTIIRCKKQLELINRECKWINFELRELYWSNVIHDVIHSINYIKHIVQNIPIEKAFQLNTDFEAFLVHRSEYKNKLLTIIEERDISDQLVCKIEYILTNNKLELQIYIGYSKYCEDLVKDFVEKWYIDNLSEEEMIKYILERNVRDYEFKF